MRVRQILSQHRRDFMAVYECGHCGETMKGRGYDDANFHQNVIPTMECGACGAAGEPNYRPLTTKYPEGFQV
jgi:primosomal protein N'